MTVMARLLPQFPAQVVAGNGIDIAKSNGIYTISSTVVVPVIPSLVVVNKGTVNSGTVTFNVSQGVHQKLTVGGVLTVATTGWPATGTYGELEIELVNGGTNVTWPTARWYIGDGTTSPNFTAMNVALSPVGTNWVVLWSTDGGATINGRAI